MGEALADADEVLFRQIHPTWVEDDGEPSSQPFMPTKKDNNMLSVDRSALTEAPASHALYIASGRASVAVYSLTVGEFSKEKLPCHANPLEKTDTEAANPAHALADYTAYSANQQKNIAKRLKLVARARGCLYSPPAAATGA